MILGLVLGGIAAACTLGKGAIDENEKNKKIKKAVSEEVTAQTADIRDSIVDINARLGVVEQATTNNSRTIEELKSQFHIT